MIALFLFSTGLFSKIHSFKISYYDLVRYVITVFVEDIEDFIFQQFLLIFYLMCQ